MIIKEYSQALEIWLQFEDGLNRYIFKKTKNVKLANEINQQVLMKVINSCCSGVQIKNVRSWLFQIANNTTIDYLKKNQKFVDLEIEVPESQENQAYGKIAPFVESLIGLLPEKYGVPLRMSDIDGLKQQEVANKLSLSLTATKSRIQRARKLLRKKVLICFDVDKKSVTGLEEAKLKDSCTCLQPLALKLNQ